jgi:hypothetical protein
MANIIGTSGNDTLIDPGSGGSLVIVVSGQAADGGMPTFDVQVNGVAVQTGITVTADHATGATQTISVPISGPVTSVGINYTNDLYDYTNNQDRNLYISSVTLDGTALSASSASYARTANGAYYDTIPGQQALDPTTPGQIDMQWGGTLTFSGSAVANASAAGSVATSNTIDGGAGIDTLVFTGNKASFSISQSGSNWIVTNGVETDTITNVERLQFSDVHHAIDMNGNAGTVAKLIATMWGESYLTQKDFVGVGLQLADQGKTEAQLADLAANTSQFQARAGSFSNADFVHTIAANLGYTGDVTGYISQLDGGQMTKGALAAMAADYMASTMSDTNHVQLMGVMHGGIDFS